MTNLTCDQAREELRAARRGELSAERTSALEQHLAGCAECRAERALDAALARLPERAAPAQLRERLLASLEAPATLTVARESEAAVPVASAPHKVPPTKKTSRSKYAWASMSAALAIALVIGAGALQNSRNSELLLNEAVNDHLRVLYAQRAIEIESGGIHQVKPWFEGRLDFAPQLDFDGDDEFALTGGAVGYFVDRKAAVFIYKYRLHVMTLFVFRAEGLPWPQLASHRIGTLETTQASSRGFNSVLFRHGDLGYALVSDASAPTVDRLAAKLVRP